MLQQADEIRRIAQQARDPEAGSIRLGLFPTLAPYLLPHVVPAVHARFPHLELLLVEEKTEVVLARLRAGELDAGVLALPVNHEGLRLQPLFTEEFVLAVPADHPLAASGGPVDLSVLAAEDLLLLEEGHCLRDQALEVCRLSGGRERRGFRATSLETLRQMVAAGVGVTLLPHLAVHPPVPPSPEITLLRFTDPAPSRQIALLWRDTATYQTVLPELARLLAALPPDLVRPAPTDPS